METYSFLREIADSWVLLAMFAFFMGVAIWAFLPSQNKARDDASNIPFRNEDEPAAAPDSNDKKAENSVTEKLKGQAHV